MTKKSIPIHERIEQLEQQKIQLLAKRKEELFNIFLRNEAIAIDNKVLTGFLLYLRNPDNKHSEILKQFTLLGNRSKPPSSAKSFAAESTTQNSQETEVFSDEATKTIIFRT